MNILTFDIEEWFHLLENESTSSEEQWNAFPSRIHGNIDRLMDILARHGKRATFFVIGWIAERYPEIVRRIADAGYEIGFHTRRHTLIHQMTPDSLREDLRHGLGELENITGRKVEAFRAPGFSLTENCTWAFEVLAESGIRYDSSVFPARHAHGGFPSFPHGVPTLIKTPSGDIMEFPISTGQLFGKHFIYSGGGYFRLLPYPVIKYLSRNENYLMAYLHPRDMDAGQPVLKGLSAVRHFKSYVGLKACSTKFEKWLQDTDFTDIGTAIKLIDYNQMATITV
ncbi:MAG: polysaccharide deacetylase family protein [Dysgonamonadaceae bacterium]|jgi:polysaccharide deacetylase family protein (PEP-CTERM system associated)|nr:polysaccharide deacetylase family protein [Dysgonamonadaceae bacterium]